MIQKSKLKLPVNLENHLITLIKKDFSEQTLLCQIMTESGSDKCSDWHNYTPIYSSIFDDSKDFSINFLELGIFKGCSVKGWKRYFKNSVIYAADVEKDYLVEEDRIQSYLCDQDNSQSIISLWNNFSSDFLFDVIIDDGKHEFSSNLNFLENSIYKLKEDGIFIIEDLTQTTQASFSSCINDIKNKYRLKEIFLLNIPSSYNTIDNCLLVIRK